MYFAIQAVVKPRILRCCMFTRPVDILFNQSRCVFIHDKMPQPHLHERVLIKLDTTEWEMWQRRVTPFPLLLKIRNA